MNFGWRFPILDGGKRQGINDSGIATFAGEDLYNNLAREICQNSLDARDNETNDPVTVSFSLKSIFKGSFAPIEGLEKTLKRCKEYWSTFDDTKLNYFLNDAFDTLSNDQLDILVISDYNTIGLNGSKNRSGAWDALTGSNGVSYKTNGSQGSFGIGKNAPYACSNLRTVFYNTYSKKDNVKAFQGVTSLVTHLNENSEETQGCGFYYNVTNRCPIYEEDNCVASKYFPRNQYGTDIIVIGFKKTPNWKDDIKLAIIKNFFIAIINNKLIVQIDDIIIDSKTIVRLVREALNSNPEDNEILKVNNYCTTYNSPDKLFTCTILEKDDAKLYVKLDDTYTRSIACLRATGMLIKQKKIKKMKPYEAVLFVDGLKMNEWLKLMEPPKHDKWDPAMLSEEMKKDGRKIIRSLDSFVSKSIESMCKMESYEEIDPDGISSFLPDDTDFINQKGKKGTNKTDIDPISEIENVKKQKPNASTSNMKGTSTQGTKTENGDVHNDTDSNEDWDTKYPNPGIEDGGDDKIVKSDPDGVKNFDKVVNASYRVIPLKYEYGIYNFIFTSNKCYTKAIFLFKCVGEDGKSESVQVLGYKKDGRFVKTNAHYLEVSDLKQGESRVITVKLDTTERVLLNVGGMGNEIIR